MLSVTRHLPARVTGRTVYQGSVRVISSARYASGGSVKAFIPQASTVGHGKTVENNLKTDTNRLSRTLQRFWENVDVKFNEDNKHHEVQIDGKTIKSPLNFPMAFPEFKKQIAHLIAHEWSNVPDLKVKHNTLPLTSLGARAVDLVNIQKDVANKKELEAKVGNLDDIKFNMLRYLDTDTCLIFTTHDEYEGKLRRRQDELYLDLIAEYEDFFTAYAKSKGDLLPSHDSKVTLAYLDCNTDGLRGNRQPILTQNVALAWLNELPIYDLVALEKAILTSKSFLCGASLLRSNCGDPERLQALYQFNKPSPDQYFFKTIDEIVELGNLETIFQTEEWGEVEDTHDVDKVDWLRNLSSAAILCY